MAWSSCASAGSREAAASESGCRSTCTSGSGAQDDRFVVRPGHETIELERAIEWTDEYVIVDKIKAAEPLVADDPRGAPSS